MSYTTTSLLNAIKRRSFMPTGQTTFSTSDILEIADEVLKEWLLPDILKARQGYFEVYKDIPLVAEQAGYDIPVRAIGLLVSDVQLMQGSKIDTRFRHLDKEELTSTTAGTPYGFVIRSNQIVVYPAPSAAGRKLRVFFDLNPSDHVETSAAAVISAIDTGTNTLTVSSIPSSWSTGTVVDLIRQDGGQEPRTIDVTTTSVSGTDIVLPSLPDGLAVGDYVAKAGETPLVQLPPNYRSVLAQGAAAEILESMNQPGGTDARGKFEEMRKTAIGHIKPRVHGEQRTATHYWF